MPIKPENKAKYPANWSKEIVPAIRERSGNKCELCGVPNYELGGRAPSGKWHKATPTGTGGRSPSGLEWPEPGDWAWCQGYDVQLRIVRIVLTVMHLNHKEEDCRPENLKHACQRCHLRYDVNHHKATAEKTRRAKLGMKDLFDAGN
jgi:hypothetical protein